MLKTLLIIILTILACYLAAMLFLLLRQKKMIFYPVSEMAGAPSDAGLVFEDVNFTSRDGTGLNGWFIPAENAEYTVLFCHGNGGNISHRIDTISLFHTLPVNFFIFDYRSYGKSDGKISEKGLYDDAAAAWTYLVEKRGIAPGKIIVVGRSLGGAIAARTAAAHSPAGLILESTFSSMPGIARKVAPWLAGEWLVTYKFPTITDLGKAKCPVLIIASRDDSVVPFEFGQELLAGAPEPKAFVELTGDHDDCYFLCRVKYVAALKKFLHTCSENPKSF